MVVLETGIFFSLGDFSKKAENHLKKRGKPEKSGIPPKSGRLTSLIFSKKNAVTDHSHTCCNITNKIKDKLVLEYNKHKRQHMSTSSSQA